MVGRASRLSHHKEYNPLFSRDCKFNLLIYALELVTLKDH